MLPSVYLATSSLGKWPYELKTSLLYGFHKFLHVILQELILMLQGVCTVDMAPKKIVYIVSNPWIARTEEPFAVSFSHLIYLLVKHLD